MLSKLNLPENYMRFLSTFTEEHSAEEKKYIRNFTLSIRENIFL